LISTFKVAREKVRVVHNPVQIDVLAELSREALPLEHAQHWTPPVLVAAGRLAEVKNYELMIAALAQLRERVPATLVILGQGDRESALRQQIAATGLDDAVMLCGFQANPWKYIARADGFVLTSRYEGFGNVLIEAMACGVPVVATASAGTVDIVTNGRDGYLVKEHTPAAVAAALERMLCDEPRRVAMGSEARRTAQRFAADTVAHEYERVLQEVLV
jgi:glycosyltransferase involved in cell wall biosynthesis